jgi:hypothetical protein
MISIFFVSKEVKGWNIWQNYRQMIRSRKFSRFKCFLLWLSNWLIYYLESDWLSNFQLKKIKYWREGNNLVKASYWSIFICTYCINWCYTTHANYFATTISFKYSVNGPMIWQRRRFIGTKNTLLNLSKILIVTLNSSRKEKISRDFKNLTIKNLILFRIRILSNSLMRS